MFVGLLTAPLRNWSFKRLVEWASKNGFKGLEVAVSPSSQQINIDNLLKGGASEVRKTLENRDIEITSLAFYSIKILESPEDQKFLKKVIEAASTLDVEVVCTLAGGPKEGKDKKKTIMEDFPEIFGPIADEAKAHSVKIAFENWFATNLQGLDHFQAVLEAVPSNVLGFNFDPSHLFWQQIDYIEAVHQFGDRIFHTHAKDTEILPFKLRKIGVLGRGWWRYRIPGWGDLDWTAYITALKEVGYDFVLSIEHEDPFFSPEEGFLRGKEYLQRLV
ncbi:sugar phosphate isomerase/epimerase [Candidatus Bathyarchaeota archaeon]|nr:MAG: sugar phosphate isomerase/epimerase [Candidatus Bathyarchaeota archaeon]